MKYALLNCWTDENKGDLGIMIATVQEIKKRDSNATFIAVSCFQTKDPYFSECHTILSRYVDAIYPAILGTLSARWGKFVVKNSLAKGIVGIFDFIRFGLCLLLPARICSIPLTKAERSTIKALKDCDMLIAKGGSVFLNSHSFRSNISLLRLCTFYFLLKKLKCRYVILGQSFGPVYGRICTEAVNAVIKNSERTYIRERLCVRAFPELKLKNDNIWFSNDIAFLLTQEESDITLMGNDIGMTLRPVGNSPAKAEEYFTEIISYLVLKMKCHVHLFIQVSDENEPDTQFTGKVFKGLEKDVAVSVTFHKENFTPAQLKNAYGKMTLFIGSRLHSMIFALGAGVPTICHIYQGTKAQGIFDELGLHELVAKTLDTQETILKIQKIMTDEEYFRKLVIENINEAKKTAGNAIDEVIRIAAGKEAQ